LGYCIFDEFKLIQYDVVDFSNQKTWELRIHKIKEFINTLCKQYQPELISLEDTQMQGGNKLTYGKLCGLKYLIIDYCIENNIPYVVVHSKSWKSYCQIDKCDRSKDKEASINFVKNKFNIEVSDDVSDAVCQGFYVINNIKTE
jgi:Holliday junction resolvasome RuvABC endonuclease subunit